MARVLPHQASQQDPDADPLRVVAEALERQTSAFAEQQQAFEKLQAEVQELRKIVSGNVESAPPPPAQ